MDNTPKHLLLIDISSVIYRNFHALPDMSNSRGEPTNALFGTMRSLESVHRKYPQAHMLAVMDSRKPSFRQQIYTEYKANRSAMPDDLSAQIGAIEGILDARGIRRIRMDGMEADDLIASIVRRYHDECEKIHIMTIDKDLAQLVDERVSMIYGKDNATLDENAVQEKFSVLPGQIIDYLCLLGDNSDNIPGVPGIGPKSAVQILDQGRSLDEFIAQAPSNDKFLKKISPHQDTIKLARSLIALKDDLDLPDDLINAAETDFNELRRLYQHFELKSLLLSLDEIDPQQNSLVLAQQSAVDCKTSATEPMDLLGFQLTVVDSLDSLQQMCQALSAAKLICLDTETSGLDYSTDTLVGLSVAIEPDKVWYIPLAHCPEDNPTPAPQLATQQVLERLEPILNNPEVAILGQNLKFDSNVIFFASAPSARIELPGLWHDTMLQACLLKSQPSERVNLDALALKHLGRSNVSYKALIKEAAKRLKKPMGQINFSHIPVAPAAEYSAEDVVVCLSLHKLLYPQIQGSDWRSRIYHELDIPLAKILARMERRGIALDRNKLHQAGEEFSEKIDIALSAIESIAERTVNPDSPKQLAELMFDKLQLPVLAKTSGGQPSTDASVLERLAREFPTVELPGLVLDYRAARKLKSTYIDDLLGRTSDSHSRVHTHFQQGVTLTGRLSSDSPNLQNIPVRSEDGLRIRSAFVAGQHCRLLSFDYSQIELRIIAHFSQDASLLKAFNAGEDIHRFTAAEIFGIELNAVDSHQRRVAKTINFGLVYGMTSRGLAIHLDLSFAQAQDYINMYFERYPGVKEYMEQTRQLARDQGYVESLLGRQILIAHIGDRNIGRRQHAERVAINAPVQSSGADIITQAMIDLNNKDLIFGPHHSLLLQVHDELLFEVHQDHLDSLSRDIAAVMRAVVKLRVPLEVNIASGNDWAQLA